MFLPNNNLHTVVLPFAVFGIAEDPFVFALESSAAPNSSFIAIYLPLTVILAFIASNFDVEFSFNFDCRASSILAPFEPVWKLSGGANQECTRNARHHDSIDMFPKPIEHHSWFYVKEFNDNWHRAYLQNYFPAHERLLSRLLRFWTQITSLGCAELFAGWRRPGLDFDCYLLWPIRKLFDLSRHDLHRCSLERSNSLLSHLSLLFRRFTLFFTFVFSYLAFFIRRRVGSLLLKLCFSLSSWRSNISGRGYSCILGICLWHLCSYGLNFFFAVFLRSLTSRRIFFFFDLCFVNFCAFLS